MTDAPLLGNPPRTADRRAGAGDGVLRDPLTGQQVLIAGHRQDRPQTRTGPCPFCPGGTEAPDPYDVKAFPNRWPALPGASEVVLYTPRHTGSLARLSQQEVRKVVDLWAERTAELGRRADTGYVLVFENRGGEAGASVDHPHGQIFAFPEPPDVPMRELRSGTCALCAESVADELVVLGTRGWRAWVPRAAGWPYELRLAPRAHVPDLPSLSSESRDEMAWTLGEALRRLDRVVGGTMPSMMWIHQRPTRGHWPQAHLHVHVTGLWHAPGRRRHVAAGEHGSGVMVNPVVPAVAAGRLREA
ncbi:DUF4931 domain-containing protein [Streptomyces sp. NPDC059467]|uniref:galactose-1-phosphate uridylyltransferase n=1 Tax=Streptomyces sp. NPDC059467 TaxID=3346844 RepID=UPI0036B761D6